jgi:hypothetical protein
MQLKLQRRLSAWISNHWYVIAVVGILLLSAFLRLYQLGQVPAGMTWDEAAIGYNGYAVITTRRDEWLERLPVSFQSFGDYKAPLAIYLNGFFTLAFGMNLWAVRLPFALGGVFAVWGMMLLTRKLWADHPQADHYSLIAGGLLALSPWHLHFSRVGFESGLALALIIWASYCLLKFRELCQTEVHLGKRATVMTYLMGIVAVLLFTGTLYTYHSAKVVTPLLLLVFYGLFLFRQRVSLLPLLSMGVVGLGSGFPLIKDSLFGQGLERAGVTIFGRGYDLLEMMMILLTNTWLHFSPAYLMLGLTDSLRHGGGGLGVLYPTTFFLVLGAALVFIFNFFRKQLNSSLKLMIGLALAWIAIGALPAIITTEVPHANRMLLALPGFILLALAGLEILRLNLESTNFEFLYIGSKGERGQLKKAVFGSLLMFHMLFFIVFQNYYYRDYAQNSTEAFVEGYLEAMSIAREYELGLEGMPDVDKVIFTAKYQQPYIFALFVRQTNPIWYRGGSLIKYEFAENITAADLLRSNTLLVASGTDELPLEQADRVIYGTDGSVRFKIYLTSVHD